MRHAAAFAFYLALAMAMTWPLATQLDTAVPDLGDPLLNAWIIDWDCHALTHAPLSLFDAPMYWPARNMLAFSENMIGIALVVLPFHLAGLKAIAVYNIALLLGFAFSGYGAFVLARVITRHTGAALIAGVIHAFGSFKIAHVQHLQIVWSGWLPLLLAALLLYWRNGSLKHAVLLGAVFVMNGLTNIHWLLFGGFALAMTIGFLQFAEPRRGHWVRLIASLTIASLILLPVLVPYQIVANEYGARRTSFEARLGSATPLHWFVASSRSLLYGRFFEHLDERELFPGVVALLLVGLGVRRLGRRFGSGSGGKPAALLNRITIGRFSFSGLDVPAMILTVLVLIRIAPWLRAKLKTSRFNTEEWAAALWILIGFLGSLGWYFYLHPFLFRVVAPFRATRTPARWAAIAYVGIAVWAAIGASRVRRRSALAALLVLAIIDVSARVNWTHVPPTPPIYAYIKRAKPKAIVEVPFTGDGIPFLYLLAQTEHRVPLVNGTSGFETPAHERLRLAPFSFELLRQTGAEMAIVHEERRDVVYDLRTLRVLAESASVPRGSPPR